MVPELTPEKLLEWYRVMLLIRRFEESLVLLQRAGQSFGHFHLYIGHETIGVPAVALLGAGDFLFTTHRNHGHLLARGADPGRLLAEILGKATGYNRGKGGTLHVAVPELGVPCTSAMVGDALPMATGAAFAAKRLGDGRISACLFGEGALEEGVFYESLNLAALWALPVIFLCENNSLGALGQKAGEYPSSTIAAPDLAAVPRPFGVPSASVDGTDVAAVHRAMVEAVARARRGEGPTFIEARVVRWPGSRPLWPDLVTGETDLAMAWDSGRIPDAHREWHLNQDGLLRFTRELVESGRATREALLATDRRARAEVERAVRFALESPDPAPETAFEDVFAERSR